MGFEVLYLVRHGKAEESHPRGDRHRALSQEGRARIARLVPEAARLGFRATLVLSSPYLRALETRDLFAPVLGPFRSETSSAFTPLADRREAFDELLVWSEAGEHRSAAVFTHNPLVTELADYLLHPTATVGPSRLDLVFHTPTILAIAFEGGFGPRQGRPLWILHP